MSAPKKRLPPHWSDYIPEHTGSKVVAGAAVVTALLYFFGILRPVFESGPLPIPSRAELTVLQKDLEEHVDTLKKGVDETLEVAKAANAQAQNAITQTNDYRLDRLLQQKFQLEEQLKKTPGDAALAASLARTNIDIGKLTAAPAPQAAGPSK